MGLGIGMHSCILVVRSMDSVAGDRMITNAWALIKDAFSGFIEHEHLTRGAAIAYYTIFSIAPLLIIVIAIAGLAFGHDAAEGAIVGELGALMEER
jgi:membrane protein